MRGTGTVHNSSVHACTPNYRSYSLVYFAAQSVASRSHSMKALYQMMTGLACATVAVDRHQVAEVVDFVEC